MSLESSRLLADRHRPTLHFVPTVLRGNAVCDAPHRLPNIAPPEDAERPGRHSHAERSSLVKTYKHAVLSLYDTSLCGLWWPPEHKTQTLSRIVLATF
jgi:hypothetical protein